MTDKQNDLAIPDYPSFHRNINDTSSPVQHDDEPASLSSSSSKEMQHNEGNPNAPAYTPRKRKLKSYASTDEDVDDLNVDSSEDVDQSAMTIQTYRDRLTARLHAEIKPSRPRFASTEYSQITVDSGVDIASEQKVSQPKIDEHQSEETANQNDLFALSDDSLLDIEPSHANSLLLRTPAITHEQSVSLTEESDDFKSYLTAVIDVQIQQQADRGRSNTSEQYYSAESEFNTSLAFPAQDLQQSHELRDDSIEGQNQREAAPAEPDNEMSPVEAAQSSSPRFDLNAPSFGDWIDHVFTTFLAEASQRSAPASRSSSIISMQTNQSTIETSSSQVSTVVENSIIEQPLIVIAQEENNPSCTRSQSGEASTRGNVSLFSLRR